MHRILLLFFLLIAFFSIVAIIVEGSESKPTKNGGEDACPCGIASKALAGSQDSTQNSLPANKGNSAKLISKYPWMVQLVYGDKFHCGGVIIGTNTILTAADCVMKKSGSPMTDSKTCEELPNGPAYCGILKGKLQVRHFGKAGLGSSFAVESYVYSNEFNISGVNMYNDVALIKTKKEFPCDKFTTPICLPETSEFWENAGSDDISVVAWDKNAAEKGPDKAVLRETSLYVKECSKNDERMYMCGEDDHSAHCFRGPGGAIFATYNKTYYVVGIRSYGFYTNDCGTYASFNNVTTHASWIKKNMHAMEDVEKELEIEEELEEKHEEDYHEKKQLEEQEEQDILV